MTIDYTQIEPHNSFPVEKELNESAYFKWLEAGCPEGRDIEFWCAAERDMFGYTANEMDEAYRDAEKDNVFNSYQFTTFWDNVVKYEQEIDP